MNSKISPEVQNIIDAILLSSKIDEKKIVDDILKDIAKGGSDFTDLLYVDLSVDRSTKPDIITGAGTLLHAVEASDDLAVCSVGFRDGESNEKRRISLKDGKRIYRPFVKFFLFNDPQPGKYIKLLRGTELPSLRVGVEDDSGESASSDLVQALGNSASINTNSVNVTTVGSLIIAQNLSRKRITLKNHADAVVPVYIGPSGVTISTGHRLDIGDSITINTTAAIYGRTSGSNQTITYLEE